MNLLEASESIEITKFRGPNLLGDKVDGPYCLEAQNMEFVDDQTQTRRGFGQAWNPSAAIYSMYHWIQSQYSRLVYLTSAGAVVSRDLVTPASSATVVSSLTSALGMTNAIAGFRLYMSFFKARSANPGNPDCAYPVRIWDGTYDSGTPNVEIAFSPPLTTAQVTLSSSEPAPGSVTAGTHYFGFLIQTYNGGTPPPSPTSGGGFLPQAVVATGGQSLQITLTPATTWPDYVDTVQLIMTTADNPSRWYILPNSILAVIRGSGTAAVFDVDIDDVALQLLEEILPGTQNDYFSIVAYDGTLAGPWGALKILGYGNRMVYIYETLGPDLLSLASYIAFSEPQLPQFVTLNQNVLPLPEFKQCITGFVLGDVFYALGPGWTYAFSDNGLTPSQWVQPRLVSGAIGSPFINGILSNPSRGYAWVADRSGLYFFTGSSYPIKPVSYYQAPDWQRINWLASPDSMEIVDDTENRMVFVKVALDGASSANYWLVWDYTNGPEAETIKYCGPWFITDFSPGATAIVISPTTNSAEVWAARRTSGNVLRLKDWDEDDLYEDDGAGIDDLYTFGYFPKGIQTEVMNHQGADLRVFGAGTLQPTAYSLDLTNPVPMAPVELQTSPSRRYFRGVTKQTEGAAISFTTGASPGSHFVLSALKWFWTRYAWRT